MIFFKRKINKQGFMLAGMLVFSSIAVLVMSVIISGAISNLKLSRRLYDREKAFHLAEAGNEYYRWHLAHANLDFKDGTSIPGPYKHNIKDVSGNDFGSFSLDITAPLVGSTMVTVESSGLIPVSDVIRKVQTKLAIPSLAKYAVVANDIMRFGVGTEISGPLHSNNGIRFDGIAHNIVTSSKTRYDDPDHDDTFLEFGVHTHVNLPPLSGITNEYRPLEMPPNSSSTRSDVFMAGRQFPVPEIGFSGLTENLSSLKSQATTSGLYFGPSGGSNQGYYILLKENDTFDLYKVNSTKSPSSGCSSTVSRWGTWSIDTKTLDRNYPIPANGIVFVEDNVWVDGKINTARITIASGRFPDLSSTWSSVVVNNDLLYTNYDGRDVIALISQGDFNIGLVSEDDLKIDAALIAQNGRVGRHSYSSNCGSEYTRHSITLYGMIATKARYGFSYTASGVYSNGYILRTINYDSHLLYGPPPSFPLTSSQYSTISWKEIAP